MSTWENKGKCGNVVHTLAGAKGGGKKKSFTPTIGLEPDVAGPSSSRSGSVFLVEMSIRSEEVPLKRVTNSGVAPP